MRPCGSDFVNEEFTGFKVGKRVLAGTVSLRLVATDTMSYQKSEGKYVLGNSLGLRNRTDFICPDERLMRIWNPAVVKSNQKQDFILMAPSNPGN